MANHQDLKEWQLLNEKVNKEEKELFLTEAEIRSFPKYKNASTKKFKMQSLAITN
jgi:hypothetical protein